MTVYSPPLMQIGSKFKGYLTHVTFCPTHILCFLSAPFQSSFLMFVPIIKSGVGAKLCYYYNKPGWDRHILAFSSLYNSDLTSGLADPCKITNCTSELPAANMTVLFKA